MIARGRPVSAGAGAPFAAAAEVHVGTSGWVYKEWAKTFYAVDWPKNDALGYYASQFRTVEVNATFYRLAKAKEVRAWKARVGDHFVFALKGSRFITHMLKLKNPRRAIGRFFRPLRVLKNTGSIVLWQLPPQYRFTPELFARLEDFLDLLPAGWRYAVEFRDPAWVNPGVDAMLRARNVCTAWVSSLDMPPATSRTADFVYLRFHGLENRARHHYTPFELEPWARALEAASQAGLESFVYFNNDLDSRAPENAKDLLRRLQRAGPASSGSRGSRTLKRVEL